MNISDYISLTLGLVAAALVIWQIQLAIREMRADHDRRKKESTFNYLASTKNDIIMLSSQLRKYISEGNYNNEAESIDSIDPDVEIIVRKLLSIASSLSVGVNTNIFDRDLVYRASSKTLEDLYRLTQPYIRLRQAQNPYYYCEFIDLIENMQGAEQYKLRGGEIIIT